jgi:[methyl-Co(III) methanol-specific corrinoid protein]:coenzyme M methyltransferase
MGSSSLSQERKVMSEWMTPKGDSYRHCLVEGWTGFRLAIQTSVATVELMEETGAFFPRFTWMQKDGYLGCSGHEILGFDTIMPYFSVQVEAPVLGCEMNWGNKETMPDCITHPYKEAEDIVVPTEEELLKFHSIRTVIDAIRILRENYSKVAIIGKALGPWTLAYHGYGVQNFLMDTLLDPERVRRSLEKLQEISVMFANLQVRAGADAICFPDHATGDLVSPEMYRDFLVPLHKRITQLDTHYSSCLREY